MLKMLLFLKKLISGEEDEWPNERQWVFYDVANMANMSDTPLQDELSQTVHIENIQSKSHNLDFMGILKGDLDKLEIVNEDESLDRERNLKNRGQSKNISIFPNPFVNDLKISNTTGKRSNTKNIFFRRPTGLFRKNRKE